MTKSELKESMDSSLEDFKLETKNLYKAYSKEPATLGDLSELSKQVTYVLGKYKDALLEYLN